jgi:hypothetical protein
MSCHVGWDVLPHSQGGLVDITNAQHQDAPHPLPMHVEKYRDVHHTYSPTALSAQR